MYLIVMSQGKSREKLRDDLYKKNLIYFNSVTSAWNVKESTETSWFHPSKDQMQALLLSMDLMCGILNNCK